MADPSLRTTWRRRIRIGADPEIYGTGSTGGSPQFWVLPLRLPAEVTVQIDGSWLKLAASREDITDAANRPGLLSSCLGSVSLLQNKAERGRGESVRMD